MSKKFLVGILAKAGLTVEGITDLQGQATAITVASNDNSTKIATTAFVRSQGYLSGITSGNVISALGYTPVPNTRSLTINGTTYDLSADRSWTITTDASARSILRFVATASQTTFTISGGYTPGLTDVYRNGVKLDNSTDFTATNGTTIVLTNGASVNDVIEVYRYQTAFLANNALRVVTEFVATAGQTVFNVTYNSGLVDVFYNGSKLVSSEFTAGNGTSITLAFACNLNDSIAVHAYSYAVGAFTGQAQLNGTGFVKVSGTTISYDNSTYLTTASASSTYQTILTNPVTGTGTTNTLPKFTGASTIGNSNVTDSGTLITLGSNTRINGSIGIDVEPVTNVSLRVNKIITGNIVSTGISQAGAVQSDVTSTTRGIINVLITQAASFTLSNYFHFQAIQSTIGAASIITSQVGYFVDNTLIGATNNYGFRGSIPSGTNRWNLYMDGTANNYLAGSLGIGSTNVGTTNGNLNIAKTITGGVSANGINNQGQIQSDVTNAVLYNNVTANTQAATFTLGSLVHYYAQQGTFGAGSTVTNQVGFSVAPSLIGGINNWGFRGSIPVGTNRWNIYMDGTADNYMAGSLGIGTTSLTGYNLRVNKNLTGNTQVFSVRNESTIQSDVTSQANAYSSFLGTQAASFTLGEIIHYVASQSTFGAGSTVTLQNGFLAGASLIGATNNYGFRGVIPSGTNRFNLYMDGTADNYLAGNLGVGVTPTFKLQVFNSSAGAIARFHSSGSDARFSANSGVFDINTTGSAFTISTSSVERFRIDTNGSVGIGSTSLTGYTLRLDKNITGSANPQAFSAGGTIQTDATGVVVLIGTSLQTVASANSSNVYHYNTGTGSIGAGTVIGNLYGYVASGLTQGTANFGFYGNIVSGTNRWNLYMAGTAANYLAGDTGIGTTSLGTATQLTIGGTKTAVSAISRGQLINTTLVAAANGDTLVGLDINPTFTNGAFTGVKNIALRVAGHITPSLNNTYDLGTSTSSFNIVYSSYLAGAGLFTINTYNGNSQQWQVSGVNKMQLFGSSGNLLLQNGGTFTDAGFRLDVNGTTRFIGTASTDSPPLGSELLTTSNWTSTGWTGDFTTGFSHTTGNTSVLSNTLAAVIGTYYKIQITRSGGTAGSITIGFGGQTRSVSNTRTFEPLATTTGNLTITPTSDFDGTILISVKTIGLASPTVTISPSTGAGQITMRATNVNANTIIGLEAGQRLSSSGAGDDGAHNTFIGNRAGRNSTTVRYNTFIGSLAGELTTTGNNNTAIGYKALNANTIGLENTAIGTNAGLNNTIATSNIYIGPSAGENNTTGNANVMIGSGAGRFITGGSTANTISNTSIFIGTNTRAAADGQTNQIVIGNNSTGLGTNTTVLGNSSTTLTAIYGNLVLGGGTFIDAGYRLDVNGTGRFSGALTGTSATFSGTNGVDVLGSIRTDGASNGINLRNGFTATITNPNNNTRDIRFDQDVTGTFMFKANGTMGIGTSSPDCQLVLNGSSNSRLNMRAGDTRYATLYADNGVFAVASITSIPLVFGTNDIERMRITSGGNVGIGSTNTDPLSLGRERNLAIVTTGTNAALTIVGGGAARIDFGVGSTRTAGIYSDSTNYMELFTTTPLALVFSTNATERMRITSAGNVLIGTTSDVGDKLVSNGGVRIIATSNNAYYRTIYASTDGNFYFYNGTNQGYINSAGSFVNASDIRLKKDIIDIKYGLADLLKIKPRSYNRVDVEGEYIGFIAQEIRAIIPEVVSGNEEKQLGVDYGSLVALAVKAIQELKAENDELREILNRNNII